MPFTSVTLSGVRETRRFADPINPNRYGFSMFLPVSQVPLLRRGGKTPWTAEPRFGSANSTMGKTIANSLKEGEPGDFHLKNRGILVVADVGKLEHDTLTISFDDDAEKRGVADGGTTITAIVSVLDEGPLEGAEKQFVNLRVLCGAWDNEAVEAIAEGVNTSRQVSAYTLANFAQDFDWLQAALAKLPNGVKVQYFEGQHEENGGAAFTVDDVLQIVTLVITDAPQKAYLSKKYCLDEFKKNPALYKRYADIVVDLLKMTEQIPVILARKKTNLVTFAVTGGQKKPRVLPITSETIKFSPRNSWVFPMVASLKADLDTSGKQVSWIVQPELAFESVALAMFDFVVTTYNTYKKQNAVGRDVNLYGRCFDKMEIAVERLRKS